MITTVTLNAAIDRLYLVDKLEPGEVMRVRKCKATAGGKGLNVARIAHLMREQVLATGFVGGHFGQSIEDMLARDGIESAFVHVDGESRICLNIIDESGKSTEFLEPGVTVGPDDITRFENQFRLFLDRSDVITLSGSAPNGCQPDFYEKLVDMARQQDKPIILDSSGANLKAGLLAQPTMIKPNRDELRALFGIDIHHKSEVIAAARQLHDTGIDYVVVSMGSKGAIVVCKEGVFEGVPPDVPVKNPVGCGDSMVAAFAIGFVRGYAVEEALRYALAVSSASAAHSRTGYLDPGYVGQILSQGHVTRLQGGHA